MKILALDPGGTTGAVVVDWDGSITPNPETSPVLLAEQILFEDMPMWLDYTFVAHPDIDLVVIERFFITPRTVKYTRQPEALYAIGGVLFAAAVRGIPVRMQAASDAKTAFPADAIKHWPVKGKHAKDALRHFLLSCLKTPTAPTEVDAAD